MLDDNHIDLGVTLALAHKLSAHTGAPEGMRTCVIATV